MRGPGGWEMLRTRSASWSLVPAVQFLLGFITVVSLADITMQTSETRSLCQWEATNATCRPGSVIVMEKGRYGRMRLGPCVDQNFGHVGCAGDVLSYLERLCSGRPSCVLTLPNKVFASAPTSCPRTLMKYLEFSYSCIPVETGTNNSCQNSGSTPVSSQQGHLSSAMTELSSPGTSSCPWLIRALSGQRILIRLIDFAVWPGGWETHRVQSSLADHSGLCRIYGEVIEVGKSVSGPGAMLTLCGGQQRKAVDYTSDTEAVEVVLRDSKQSLESSYFIVKYQVVGCVDMDAMTGAELKRVGDKTHVSCHDSAEAWVLTCEGGSWLGPNLTCSEGDVSWNIGHIIQSTLALPQGMLILIILCIAVLIAVIIISMGVCAIKRKRPVRIIEEPVVAHETEEDKCSTSNIQKEQYPMLSKPGRFLMDRESDYATTLQRRLAVPPNMFTPINGGRPLSYSPSLSHFSMCPVHGTYNSMDRRPVSMSTFKPQSEHIYESPKMERRGGDTGEQDDVPFYHELEPDAAQRSPVLLPFYRFLLEQDESST